ncbi:hypothetical protein DDE19_29010 [Micromonospora ureilytica]|uniref:Uncharacterized protein n=1 Tax=Micromonospora ureilytica TaxID=709868 RepID=A0A3N9XH77_9ACTN|nr:hypothetical protein DDE19_29010 [Micromonospora ureilytica]
MVSAIPVLDSVRGLALPAETYRPTAAERNIIADAVNLKTAECMTSFGFPQARRTAHLPAPNQVDRLYGISDLTTAQRYGYHLPESTTGTGGKPRADATLSPAQRLVMTGTAAGARTSPDGSPGRYQEKSIPVGGCAGEARRQTIGVDEIDSTRVADAITVGMWEKSKTDPRVVAVIGAWSDCMRQSGYQYDSPLDAGVDHPEWLRAKTPSSAEIRAAVADVGCKQRTNLIGVWFTVESAYENAAIQLHLEQLSQIRKQWEEAAAKAAQILGPSTTR